MRRAGFQGSLPGYIGLYFSRGLINQGLPSTLGGDSYRAIAGTHLTRSGQIGQQHELTKELSHAEELAKQNPKLRLGFAMTLLDRVVGLMGNNILGGIGLVLGGAILDNAPMFGSRTHHKPGDILQKHQRNATLIAIGNKSCRFVGGIRIDNSTKLHFPLGILDHFALVGDDAYRPTVNSGIDA